MHDSAGPFLKNRKLATKDSVYFHRFHPVNAHDYILERVKKERIIIFNEAHYEPRHRVFVESLLVDLYKVGFHFLGCETIPFHYEDSALNSRKYPVEATGYYTAQPQFGNMVRTALSDGYYVFGYEAVSKKSKEDEEDREVQQAQHIKLILDRNPDARIIIYCGYDHITKCGLPSWGKSMEQRLKEYTGIEPFTIEQTILTESGSPEYDDPLYKSIQLNYYAVFLDSSGKPFGGPPWNNCYDVCLYHPHTRWIHGRPDWVFENGRQPIYLRGSITLPFPCLVCAYLDGEDITKATPVDIIELKNEDDENHKALALGKGDFYILIRDTHNQTQVFRTKL